MALNGSILGRSQTKVVIAEMQGLKLILIETSELGRNAVLRSLPFEADSILSKDNT